MRAHNCQAFTLMEVLVATTILAAGIVALLGGFSLSSQVASKSIRLDEAVSIAQKQLALASLQEQTQPAEGSAGLYQWESGFVDKSHGLIQATVTVTWPDKGQNQTFKLSRIFLPHQETQE